MRSIVLSSAFPLRFDMWARQRARHAPGDSTRLRTLYDRQLQRRPQPAAARPTRHRVRANPIPYQVDGQQRIVDETALAGIAYGAGVDIGQLPAIVGAALRGDTGPLIEAASALAV